MSGPTFIASIPKMTGSGDAKRPCSSCKKIKVPIISKFKMCLDCRQKFRLRRERKILGTVNKGRVSNNLESQVGKTFINSSAEMTCTEYQTSGELFGALKSLIISASPSSNTIRQFPQFYGSYTIVAVPGVDNLQRVCLLADQLLAEARLPFELNRPISLIGDESTQTLCFACTCTTTLTTPASPSHRPGNGNNARVTFTNDSLITLGLCGGVITLKSIVDTTHPLGIPGQHIVTRLEHPVIGPDPPHGHPHMPRP